MKPGQFNRSAFGYAGWIALLLPPLIAVLDAQFGFARIVWSVLRYSDLAQAVVGKLSGPIDRFAPYGPVLFAVFCSFYFSSRLVVKDDVSRWPYPVRLGLIFVSLTLMQTLLMLSLTAIILTGKSRGWWR